MSNTLFIPSFLRSGAQGAHVGLWELVLFNEESCLESRSGLVECAEPTEDVFAARALPAYTERTHVKSTLDTHCLLSFLRSRAPQTPKSSPLHAEHL